MNNETMSVERALAVMELTPDASWEQIRQAYRELVKVWHPDRFPGDEKFKLRATRKMQEINTAYQVVQASFQSRSPDHQPEPASQSEGTPPSPSQTQTTEANGHLPPKTSTLDKGAEGSFWLIVAIYLFAGSEPVLIRLLFLGVFLWLMDDESAVQRLGYVAGGLFLVSELCGKSPLTHDLGVWSLFSFAGFGILKAVVWAYSSLTRPR